MSVTTQSAEDTGFPKFLMSVDGARSFMTMNKAGVTYNAMHSRVEIVGLVHEADGSVRDITLAERDEMRSIADQCEAEK